MPSSDAGDSSADGIAYGERYKVSGSGAVVLPLAAGDMVKIVDIEGRQPAEVIVWDVASNGNPELAAMPPSSGTLAPLQKTNSALATLNASSAEDARAVVAGLASRGIKGTEAPCYVAFGRDSLAGSVALFGPATKDGLALLVAAPGSAKMSLEDESIDRSSATSLYVYVHRAAGFAGKQKDAQPPPPLAEPRLDIRVDKASARSYTVKAGEYIQVVDIAGKQCSDFISFSQAALDAGEELDLDPTVTRTANGSSYPAPGLFSKYFDKNFRAMVEVIRDTVGRHDTFALACTPRYYEDMGYPWVPQFDRPRGGAFALFLVLTRCFSSFPLIPPRFVVDTLTAPTTSTPHSLRLASSPATRGRPSTFSTTRESTPTTKSTWTNPGRVQAIMS